MKSCFYLKCWAAFLLLATTWQCRYEEVEPLYAEFSVQGGNAQALVSVTFTNTSVGAKTWAWDFGNGQTSNSQNPPAQTYPSEGAYTVSLTVTNGAGDSDTKTISLAVGPPPPLQLNCNNASVSGSFVQGQAVSNVTVVVPYTGGNGAYGSQVFNSTGVTGLTATLTPGSFIIGGGNLYFTISGTPATAGSASFSLNIGGAMCNLMLQVIGGSISSLNCASANLTGTLTEGVITSGVSVSVPYTGGNGGGHSGQTVGSIGVSGLTATLAPGSFANGDGNLVYNISGTPASAGAASFNLNIGGKSCILSLSVSSAFVPVMKSIPGGFFTMGCNPSVDPNCQSNETPTRSVNLSAYQISETEVTQAQWQALMGNNPSYNQGCSQCPVEQVSWFDAVVFCNRLSEELGLEPCYYTNGNFTAVYGKNGNTWFLPNSGTVVRKPGAKGYRLPTEAEWERAARDGLGTTIYAGGNNINTVAWYASNSGGSTNAVKQKPVNGTPNYKLYDMSGNVWEWCADWYDAYPPGTPTDPTGPSSGSGRVFRGGSWLYDPSGCRVAIRYYYTPGFRFGDLGFRLARTP